MKMYHSFLLVFSIWISVLLGGWDPSEIKTEFDRKALEELSYLNLKNRIAIFLEGSWCSREKAHLIMDLITLIGSNRAVEAVEVGVFNGSSLLPIAAALKYSGSGGRVYAIDAWSNKEAVRFISQDDPNYQWWSEVSMQVAKQQCLATLSYWKLKSYCTILHMPSREAAAQIDLIDFLHLDGSFSGKETMNDVRLYFPKVKQGGYVLISNVFYQVNGAMEKVEALWELLDPCDVVAEIDGSNTVLLRKN